MINLVMFFLQLKLDKLKTEHESKIARKEVVLCI
jgi:hypothetical protein